ncbi:kinesin-like protein KIN-10B [Primulina eburnea]|uniref:kinesin-like protein KIN-10B n=1 Tax=Primulina eburnea TaxID=1245227 RepID=UPI003C6CB7B9
MTTQGSDERPGLMFHAMSLILSMCKSTGSTVVVSFYEIYLDNCYDLLKPKEKKIMRRKVAHTGLNDVSSRSHAVLVLTISTPSNENVANPEMNDNRKTSNEGIRLQESAKINQSLFALSNVIYAQNNKKPRIPIGKAN